MKMNFMIRATAKVAAHESCDNLDEKRIVPKMMLRRRLTRSARIMVYLADACGFSKGSVVYGSAYGEMQATADIVGAIDANEPIRLGWEVGTEVQAGPARRPQSA